MKSISTFIIIKLLKTNDEEKNLERNERDIVPYPEGEAIQMIADISSETM